MDSLVSDLGSKFGIIDSLAVSGLRSGMEFGRADDLQSGRTLI